MTGRIRYGGKSFKRELKGTETLTDDCLVLKITSGKVEKCGATDTPYAIAQQSTLNRVLYTVGETKYDTGANLGEIAMFREGWAELPLVNNNAVIAIGDRIGPAAGGKVNKQTPQVLSASATKTELDTRFAQERSLIGYAEEAVVAGSANAPGAATVKVALCFGGGMS